MNETPPNVGYRYAVAALFGILLVFVCFTKISDYDFWWHLKLGESVFETGHIYKADAFSYTFNGSPQFNAEWLGDLIIYLFFRAGGFAGANALKSVVLLATFYFLYRAASSASKDGEAGFFAVMTVLAITLFSIRFRLFVRPFIFSYLFFSIFLYLLSRHERDGNIKPLLLLPLIEILWANTSKAAVFGPALMIFFIIGRLPGRRDWKPAAVAAGVAAAGLVNPTFAGIYGISGAYALADIFAVKQAATVVGEHQPLSTSLLWGYGFKYTFAFQLLVVCSALYFARMKGWKNYFHLLLLSAFFFQSVKTIRMIDFFSLSACLVAAQPVEHAAARLMGALKDRRRALYAVLSAVFIFLIPPVVLSKTYAFGSGVKPATFPDAALEFLDKNHIEGRMFNSYPFGGYIIWKAPGRKVFIDGRSFTSLYSLPFYNSYFAMLKKEDDWNAADSKWGFDYALLEYDMTSRRFPKHITDNPDWALVYWDECSAVYLKRNEKNRAVIEKGEYKISKPRFYDMTYLMAYLHSKKGGEALDLIEKDIALNPKNQEPRLGKAFLLYSMGKQYRDAALKELEAAISMPPDMAMEHSAKAIILQDKGLSSEAEKEAGKALALDSTDPGAAFVMKKLGEKK